MKFEKENLNNLALSAAEMMWTDKTKTSKKMMVALEGLIDQAVLEALDAAGADADEAKALAPQIQEDMTEFIRRGIARGIKRTTTEYGR